MTRIAEKQKRASAEQKRRRKYAQARLIQWGNCVRRITMSGAPRGNIYSVQPFFNERVNFDMGNTERELFAGRVWEQASEVDKILMPVRESNDIQWRAVIIRYVIRERGGLHRLTQDIQLIQFKHCTGLGKSTYFTTLKRVELFLAMGLGA